MSKHDDDMFDYFVYREVMEGDRDHTAKNRKKVKPSKKNAGCCSAVIMIAAIICATVFICTLLSACGKESRVYYKLTQPYNNSYSSASSDTGR